MALGYRREDEARAQHGVAEGKVSLARRRGELKPGDKPPANARIGLLVARGFTAGVLLEPWVTMVLRVVLWILFIGWALLLLDSWRLSGSGIFRHRFKKKGRSFAFSAAFNQNQNDLDERFTTINRFFTANTFTHQIRQLNRDNNGSDELKSSILYTDALSKKWFWESFYNIFHKSFFFVPKYFH